MKEDLNKTIETLSPLERKVLPFLVKARNLKELVKLSKLSEIEVMRALQWLSNKGVLKIHLKEREKIGLGNNGKDYAKKGLPEKRFLIAVKKKPTAMNDIAKAAKLDQGEVKACIGILKGKAAIEFKDGKIAITKNGEKIIDKKSLEEQLIEKLTKKAVELDKLEAEEKFAFTNLQKRKDIIKKILIKTRNIELTDSGKKITKIKIKKVDFVDKLTPVMLRDGSWKGKAYRKYDVKINVPRVYGGKRHFVNQSIDYIKSIWIELGFKEMKGNMIQTSFWDLDTLFVPQDHPARQMQDTFYINNPKKGKLPSLYKKVKKVHEDGGDTGSKGWGGRWSEEKAKENMLRTHTTVLSAQTIHSLKKGDLPAKFFAVGKVFRNEALDWKHLFEFYQVEGIVVDPNANLKHLKGYLNNFYKKMGYEKVRMRPAHFPYTEPSVEVEVFHPVKQEWVELGGAGIFRPEVTKTLLGFECPVLAWGQGMGRIISEYFKITDIRHLYKNDIKQMKNMKTWMR